jgi:membrane protein implicated in regulation of membrane protease activity
MTGALWEMWWVWVVGGLLIGIVEVFAPGFFFLGFAGGAIVTGLLVAIWPGFGLSVLLAVFAVASVGVWLGLRRAVGVRGGQYKRIDRDINEN